MLPRLFLPLIFVAATATAQTGCPPPVVKVLYKNEVLPATGHAFTPLFTLRVTPAGGCPEQVRYRFRDAQLTLIRNGRPVLPTLLVSQPHADLSSWARICLPGDHIYVFIPYQNLLAVSADGAEQPYRLPEQMKPKPGQLDIRTEEAKGITFSWLLLPR